MKQLRSFILLLFAGYLSCSCAPVSQKQYEKNGLTPLSLQQVEQEFTARTLHLEAIDFDASILFQANKTLSATSSAGDTDTGKWSMKEDNLVCMKFNAWFFGDERCFRIIKAKNSYIFFTKNGALRYKGSFATEKDILPVAADKPSKLPQLSLQHAPLKASTQSAEYRPETTKARFIRIAQNCPDCNFSGIDFSNAQLKHANLAGANLTGANFTNANLRQANLQGANLTNATLIHANLPGANLSSANLSHANFSGSNLIRANVINATFNDTNLTGALLESIQGNIQ